ncbi:MAG: M3 family oligoendopeptidase [Candidatus Hodarchaeales archaeon]|jgi:oligoendopeptidase F
MTTTWDLTFVYKGYDDPQIEKDLEKADRLAEDLAKYRSKLATLSSSEFVSFLQQHEEIATYLVKCGSYGSLLFSQETTNDKFKALFAKVQQKNVAIGNKLIWINLEINKMDSEIFGKILNDPTLANYHHYLEVLRLREPYQLSEPVEQVLNQKALIGASAWVKFYEEYTADFKFEVEIDGEKKVLSQGEIRPKFRDTNPITRENVFKAYYQKYIDDSIAISHSFNNIWKDHGQNVDLRKYPSTMTIAHIRNQTEEKIVETMMSVVKKNYTLVQEYYKAKARLMGQGTSIKGSDLYAPITKVTKYSWKEAEESVLSAYTEFDPEIGQMAQTLFSESLIDSEIRKGKRTGAFCAGLIPALKPVIHMSFDGTSDGVATLAHEIGHALHDLFSARNQTLFNYHPPLVVAETASVFGEQILTSKLLKTMNDEEGKLTLLVNQLEDAIGTISRQTMYIFFEKECHLKGAKQTLSFQEMSDIWDKYVKEAYGDSVDFLPEQSANWASIPHFLFTRYYCYAYSFGMLFVLGLYQKYLEEGSSFIPKLKSILEAGGSQFPIDLAASVGLDIRKEEFWQAGFDYLNGLLTEFKEIVAKRS